MARKTKRQKPTLPKKGYQKEGQLKYFSVSSGTGRAKHLCDKSN
jgi:hypothetical protein